MNPTDDIQLVVKVYNRKSITIDVSDNATIKDIKNAIYREENIKPEIQTLLFEHSVLDYNNKTINDYHMETQSVINLVNKDDELKQFLQQNKLPNYENLYHILIKQNISYADLQYMNSKYIKDICSQNNIDIASTFKLSTAIDKRQNQIMKEKEQKFDHEMSVILVGDSEVGKTCLMHRFVRNTYCNDTLRTFGVGNQVIHYLTLHNESVMKITIWDTAGQERFHSLTSSYYKKGDVILYCYDISNSNSLNNCEWWFDRIKQHAKDNVLIEIIGCKSDAITNIELKPNVFDKILNCKQWQEYNIEHVECSSQTGENVENVFITAAEMKLKGMKYETEINQLYVDIQQPLNECAFDLETLRNDIALDEVDEFCNDMKFTVLQKAKFSKLMRLLHSMDNDHIIGNELEPISMRQNVLKTQRDIGGDKKSECFASDSFVICYPNYVTKNVCDVKIYDKILSYDSIQNIYIWNELLIKWHFEENEYLNKQLVPMIELTLKNKEMLTITCSHLLYVNHNNDGLQLQCADTIEIGDKLFDYNKNEIEVKSIKKNVMKYPRNLLTFNGNLVVNGFAVSSFCDTIKGENIYFGKAIRYILNNYYQCNAVRYPMYFASKVWTEYIPFNVKQYLYEFWIH